MTQEPVTRNVPPPQEATHNPAPVVQGEFAEVVPANFPQGGTAPSPFTEVVDVAPTETTTPAMFPEPPDNGGVVAVLDAESTEPGAG